MLSALCSEETGLNKRGLPPSPRLQGPYLEAAGWMDFTAALRPDLHTPGRLGNS